MKIQTQRNEIIPILRGGASASEMQIYNQSMSDLMAKNFRDTNSDVKNLIETLNGWIPFRETFSYSSADDPVYVMTGPGDIASRVSVGWKVKLTNGGVVKYFIVHAISGSSITMYGGTDYDLSSSPITEVYFSPHKAPFGFPLNPAKWTVEVTDDTTRSQEVSGTTFYNLGSISIQIPIGLWDFSYQGCFGGLKPSALVIVRTALSASASSISDSDLVSTSEGYYESMIPTERRKKLNISAKTTYYLIEQSVDGTVPTIYAFNQYTRLIIRAECAYL